MKDLTPREIVAELDRHIVGQTGAKGAVAIALRNRWRRKKAPDSIRGEITPKNILMIGPTGVGKTEVSRRLARLANAPFLKVEATKFTEVGYVGRDVEQIIRDLVEASISMIREQKREGVCGGAGKPGEDLTAGEAAHLAGIALHDGLAHGNLAIAEHYEFLAFSDGMDGGAVPDGRAVAVIRHVL